MAFLKAFIAHPDVVICFIISVLIGLVVSKFVPDMVEQYYGNIKTSHSNNVGREATDDTPRAKSIDDILNNDTFAIVVEDEEHFKYDGSTWIDDEDPGSMYNVKLLSGERVAVRLQYDKIKKIEDGKYLINIGKVIKKDLTLDSDALDELQEEYQLDRTDFYVEAKLDLKEEYKYSKGKAENISDLLKPVVGIIVAIISWLLLHFIVVKIGIAPPLFKKNH